MAKIQKNSRLTFTNKKAYHDYEIIEQLEVGIALEGSEVKAIRAGQINLKDSFIRIIKNELFFALPPSAFLPCPAISPPALVMSPFITPNSEINS